jgi:hypothetical protein
LAHLEASSFKESTRLGIVLNIKYFSFCKADLGIFSHPITYLDTISRKKYASLQQLLQNGKEK